MTIEAVKPTETELQKKKQNRVNNDITKTFYLHPAVFANKYSFLKLPEEKLAIKNVVFLRSETKV